MREILNFPQIDKQKLEVVKKLIDDIAETSNSDCSDELEQLNLITGKIHEPMEFAEYWSWTDLDTLAKITLTLEPPRIQDLTKKEIEELISIIKECFIEGEDSKAEYYVELLHKSLPLSNVMDYIMSGNDVAKIADNMITAASNSIIFL